MQEISLKQIFSKNSLEPALDIIFIHGLGGDATSSWHPAGNPGLFWPQWLADDIPMARVWTLNYPAAWTKWLADASGMGILDRSRNILQYLVASGLGKRPIVFIAHSLGGLMVKQLLRTASSMQQSEWKTLLMKVQGVQFLATPHTGSSLAQIANVARSALRPSKLTNELEAGSSYLRDLGDWFQQNAGPLKLKVGAYYESDPLKGITLIVDAVSANPGVVGCVPVAVDGDHFTLCKPTSRESLVYLSIKSFINSFLEGKPWQLYLVPGYSNREQTLRSLLENTSVWPISSIFEEDSLRLFYTFRSNPISDNVAHIFAIDIKGILEKSELESLIEMVALVRLQGRDLNKKPVFILMGNDDERSLLLEQLRRSERDSFRNYFRCDNTLDKAALSVELQRLRKVIVQEWLLRPNSYPAPV